MIREETDRGSALRDAGIEAALDHANEVHPEWSERAWAVLMEYGPKLGEFTPFDIRACAIAKGIPTPPDARSWGGIMRRARGAGKIVLDGYVQHPDPKSHKCPTKRWRWVG